MASSSSLTRSLRHNRKLSVKAAENFEQIQLKKLKQQQQKETKSGPKSKTKRKSDKQRFETSSEKNENEPKDSDKLPPDLFSKIWPFNHCKLVLSFKNDSENDAIGEDSKSKSGWSKEGGKFVYHELVTPAEKEEFERWKNGFYSYYSDESSYYSSSSDSDSDDSDIFIPIMQTVICTPTKLVVEAEACNETEVDKSLQQAYNYLDKESELSKEAREEIDFSEESPSTELLKKEEATSPSFSVHSLPSIAPEVDIKTSKVVTINRKHLASLSKKALAKAKWQRVQQRNRNVSVKQNTFQRMQSTRHSSVKRVCKNELTAAKVLTQDKDPLQNFKLRKTQNAPGREKQTEIKSTTRNLVKNRDSIMKLRSITKNEKLPKIKTAILKLRKCDNLITPHNSHNIKDTMKYRKESNVVTVSQQKPFKCSKCSSQIQRKPDFARHVRMCHNEKPYKCSKCPEQFSYFVELCSHARIHMSDPYRSYSCSTCSKQFSKKQHLTLHIHLHTGERPFKCLKCNKQFTRSDHLRGHQKNCRGNRVESSKPIISPGRVSVKECFVKLQRCDSLLHHSNAKSEPISATLTVAPAFVGIAKMPLRGKEKPFKCVKCSKCFSHKGGLTEHLRIHDVEKQYICTICSKPLCSKAEFIKHNRTHTGEKPFKCLKCSKAFSQIANLKRHNLLHARKPYKCSKCPKNFVSLQHCRMHERMHDVGGEKMYDCLICAKAFFTRTGLAAHSVRHDDTKKRFNCLICFKAFFRISELNIHERIHTGEKPYKCSNCGMRFTQSIHLRRHSKVGCKVN